MDVSGNETLPFVCASTWPDHPKYTSRESQAGTCSLEKQLPQPWPDPPKLGSGVIVYSVPPQNVPLDIIH